MTERHLRVGPVHPTLEHALSELIGVLRTTDRLSPISVLVPTHVLGRHLMRTVARRYGACFNVRFHTFPDLAEAIGFEDLVASRWIQLPPLGDFLVARKAVNASIGDSGYFAPIRNAPGTPRAVLASLTDLKKAGIGPDQLHEFAAAVSSQKLEELSSIYREIKRLQVEAGYFDWSERLAMAARAAQISSFLAGALAVCVYGFAELNRLEQDLLAACLHGRPGYAFVPEDVAGYARPLIDWLQSQGFVLQPEASDDAVEAPEAVARELFRDAPKARPIPCDVQIVSAPGTADEIRALAREILAHAQQSGASFSDVAVLLRHPDVYERTIRDVFDSSGIPYVFLDGILPRDTLAGRLLRLLVRIRRFHYPRAEMMELLELVPLRGSLLEEAPEASPADWDRYTREAGIVRGRDHWRRLPAMHRRIEWRISRLRQETADTSDDPYLRLLESDVRSLRVLEHVINILLKRLEAIPDRGTIGALVTGLVRTLHAVAALADEDRAVVQALTAVAHARFADEELAIEAFPGLIDDLLAERRPPTDVYRSGRVTVSSLSGAFGLPFKLVLVPGLVERSFPPPTQQDPVLLDHEREAISTRYRTSLALRAHRASEERFVFRHALGAAAARLVLTFPRLDAVTGQFRVPSHYLLRVAEALTGQPADYRTLDNLIHRIPVGRIAQDKEPLTPSERDLAAVACAVASRDPRLLDGLPGRAAIARGTLAEASRWGPRVFSKYDGMLGVPVPLPSTMAATQLETYGLCPFRFFGERILGVREIDEPEAVETISPLDRGALLHDILERFFTDLVRDSLVPLRAVHVEEYRRRLQATAEEAFRRFERSGAVGYPFMWSVEKARIRTDLEGMLSFELDDASGFVPAYFEARFGPTPPWATLSLGSMPHPLELKIGDRTVQFTGYIDRIDVGPQGTARVIDYKTGGVYGAKDDRFLGGQALQLPLYIRAADAMLAHNGQPARTVEALYYYATGKGRFRRVQFTRETLEARAAEFATILRTISEGIASGMFPQHPGKDGENCTYCPFQPVCGHGRARLVERKSEDPSLAPLAAMWEIE